MPACSRASAIDERPLVVKRVFLTFRMLGMLFFADESLKSLSNIADGGICGAGNIGGVISMLFSTKCFSC